MSGPLGFVIPVISVGIGSLLFKPTQRGFYPKSSSGANLDPIVPQITIEETHHDEMEITEHPIERGASISDHAYKKPAEVVIRCAWSNSPPNNPGGLIGMAVGVAATVGGSTVRNAISAFEAVKAAQSILNNNASDQVKQVYQQLLDLQASAIPFDVLTGKRAYKSMLFKGLSVMTDSAHENSILLTITCKQVLLVATQVVKTPVNSDAQALPDKTTPITNMGTAQLKPAPNFVTP